MDNWIPSLIILIFVAFLIFRRAPGVPPPLYTDDGVGSRVFTHKKYGITAKPDLVEGTKENATLIEFKRRSTRVYDSDKVQVIASALALRGEGINVTKAFVEIGNGKRAKVDVNGTDDELLGRIRVPLEHARLVEAGGVPPPTPSTSKCSGCGYRAKCPHVAKGGRR